MTNPAGHTAYTARYNLPVESDDGERNTLHRGRRYLTKDGAPKRRIIDAETGEVLAIPDHVGHNIGWYFARVGAFNDQPVTVSQADYIHALVVGNEGLDFEALYEIALGEGFAPWAQGNPTKTTIKKNVFTAALAVDRRIAMQLNGVKVHGTAKDRGHKKGFTYHKA